MKVIILLAGLFGLTNCQNWELSEVGLCIEKPASCPTRVQRYGICCKINNVPTEFNNYCQACAAVKIYLFRVANNGNINFPPTMYADDTNYRLILNNLFNPNVSIV